MKYLAILFLCITSTLNAQSNCDGNEPNGIFFRGDANNDNRVDLSDPSYMFNFLFVGGADFCERDSADVNDDGYIDLSDPIYLLNYLYRGGDQPPTPFQLAGMDNTEDDIANETSPWPLKINSWWSHQVRLDSFGNFIKILPDSVTLYPHDNGKLPNDEYDPWPELTMWATRAPTPYTLFTTIEDSDCMKVGQRQLIVWQDSYFNYKKSSEEDDLTWRNEDGPVGGVSAALYLHVYMKVEFTATAACKTYSCNESDMLRVLWKKGNLEIDIVNLVDGITRVWTPGKDDADIKYHSNLTPSSGDRCGLDRPDKWIREFQIFKGCIKNMAAANDAGEWGWVNGDPLQLQAVRVNDIELSATGRHETVDLSMIKIRVYCKAQYEIGPDHCWDEAWPGE